MQGEWKVDQQDQFGLIVAAVFGLHLRDASDEVIEMYYRALKKHEFENVKRAFDEHVADPDAGKFLPKPADIVQRICGDSNKKSLSAWIKAYHAVSAHGSYTSVVFDDPIIHVVVQNMGGWERFCFDMNEKSEKFMKRDFIDFYKVYLSYEKLPETHHLVGRSERENNERGFNNFKRDIKYIGVFGNNDCELLSFERLQK